MKIFALAVLTASLSISFAAHAANKPAPRPAAPASAAAQQPAQTSPSPLIVTMGQELDREMPILSKATPAAYFMSYTLTSSDRTEVMGSNGALLSSEESRSRWLETQVRVGSYDLDNTHKVGNSAAGPRAALAPPCRSMTRRTCFAAPCGCRPTKQYRTASEGLIKINTSKEVQVADRRRTRSRFFPRATSHVLRPGSFRTSRPQALGRQKSVYTRARFASRRRF